MQPPAAPSDATSRRDGLPVLILAGTEQQATSLVRLAEQLPCAPQPVMVAHGTDDMLGAARWAHRGDAALIMTDAEAGMTRDLRRQIFVAALLGLPNLVLVAEGSSPSTAEDDAVRSLKRELDALPLPSSVVTRAVVPFAAHALERELAGLRSRASTGEATLQIGRAHV